MKIKHINDIIRCLELARLANKLSRRNNRRNRKFRPRTPLNHVMDAIWWSKQ